MIPFHPVEDSSASAAICVPLLMEWFGPRRVLDLGCNVGTWVKEFRGRGVFAIGLDGPGMDADVVWDLRKPWLDGQWGRFDLVLCLEVAEHVEPEYANSLVDTAVFQSDRIIWSAATPGQGGFNHVNERPHGYWVLKFAAHGYLGRPLSHLLPMLPHDYYRKNMWCFEKPL